MERNFAYNHCHFLCGDSLDYASEIHKKGAEKMKNSRLYNILSGIGFLIATALAWYFSLILAFDNIHSVGVSVFAISLIYITAVIIYAIHSDKYWNIPCMAYMLFMAVSSFLYLCSPDYADDLIIWTIPPVMGLEFLFTRNFELMNFSVIIFSLIVLFITGSKYFPKGKPSNG